jgi:hypothetical protein
MTFLCSLTTLLSGRTRVTEVRQAIARPCDLTATAIELLGDVLCSSQWKCWDELLSAGGVVTQSADLSCDSPYLRDTSERYMLPLLGSAGGVESRTCSAMHLHDPAEAESTSHILLKY